VPLTTNINIAENPKLDLYKPSKLPLRETILVAQISTKVEAVNIESPTTMVGDQLAHGRRKNAYLSLLIESRYSVVECHNEDIYLFF
jgi:hypothetical protein